MVGLSDFAGSDSNGWPTGPDFQNCAETGPVGHPLEIEPAKSSNPTRFWAETGPVGHPLEFEPAKSAKRTRFLSKTDP